MSEQHRKKGSGRESLDEVDEAGVESFPASDPPAHNMPGRGKRESGDPDDQPKAPNDRPPRPAKRGTTTAAMRDAMPSGRTMGKSSARDPAAAPFDTDDEAAGRPAERRAIAAALRDEKAHPSFDIGYAPAAAAKWPEFFAIAAAMVVIAFLLMTVLS